MMKMKKQVIILAASLWGVVPYMLGYVGELGEDGVIPLFGWLQSCLGVIMFFLHWAYFLPAFAVALALRIPLYVPMIPIVPENPSNPATWILPVICWFRQEGGIMMRSKLLTFVAILWSIGSGCGHLERAVPTSDGAQTSTGNLAAKIVDLLPPRWSCIESNGTIIVTRDAAVRFINLINAPARLPTETEEAYYLAHSYLCPYRISINSEPRLSQSEVDDVRRENEKVSQTLFKLRAKMNHIAHKFDSYSTLDPEKAKLVQEYENTKKRLRRSPRYYCGDQTVYVSIEPDGPGADVMSADVSDECTTVLWRIQDLFKRYAE